MLKKTLLSLGLVLWASIGTSFAQQSGEALFQMSPRNLPLSFSGAFNLELEIAAGAFSGEKT